MTARGVDGRNPDIVLKNGLLVDGSGARAYHANLLIRGGRIHRISRMPIRTTGLTIDCTGRVVAPGFIDAHSHLDWHVPIKGHDELKYPFVAQGITTVVAGNCGTSAAGFRPSSSWKDRLADNMMANGFLSLQWDSVADYFERLASSGISHNLALLAGHGSTRISIRGLDPSPLHPYEIKELLWLLEKAMAEGARGVSMGLQYEPGIYSRPEELREVALLVRRKGKILSVHLRAYSALAPGYPLRLGGEPHNLIALREILDLARSTGVRLEISHLIFVGSRTWRTAEKALRLIDLAIAQGVDVKFDTYPYPFGASWINVVLPSWFLARGAAAYEETASLRKLKRQIFLIERLLGFGPAEVQVTDTRAEELAEYNGRFLNEIARVRRLSPVDALIDIAHRSGGRARVLCHRYSNDRILEELVRHPASLFMTDAWVDRGAVQNPAAYAAFPRLLSLIRDRKLLSVEDGIRKMTGATAERFAITDRGLLKEGMAADIVVLDWEGIQDNTTGKETDKAPSGVEYVFVNGVKIIGSGKKENPLSAGVPLA
ncbi:MAG TPA: amidohydrolase family protein [Spirochaetia bacterium]|nr:amidohydrolase family protein [Spirochaetia bacterium]